MQSSPQNFFREKYFIMKSIFFFFLEWTVLKFTGIVNLWTRQVLLLFFFSMKGDGFQSAIIRAHSFTLNMQHSGCTQGRLFLFHFHNFYGAARSLHGVCFEFSLQRISDCFCTDLGVPDVAESSLSPVRHHDITRGGASGRIAKICQCRLPWKVFLSLKNCWSMVIFKSRSPSLFYYHFFHL